MFSDSRSRLPGAWTSTLVLRFATTMTASWRKRTRVHRERASAEQGLAQLCNVCERHADEFDVFCPPFLWLEQTATVGLRHALASSAPPCDAARRLFLGDLWLPYSCGAKRSGPRSARPTATVDHQEDSVHAANQDGVAVLNALAISSGSSGPELYSFMQSNAAYSTSSSGILPDVEVDDFLASPMPAVPAMGLGVVHYSKVYVNGLVFLEQSGGTGSGAKKQKLLSVDEWASHMQHVSALRQHNRAARQMKTMYSCDADAHASSSSPRSTTKPSMRQAVPQNASGGLPRTRAPTLSAAAAVAPTAVCSTLAKQREHAALSSSACCLPHARTNCSPLVTSLVTSTAAHRPQQQAYGEPHDPPCHAMDVTSCQPLPGMGPHHSCSRDSTADSDDYGLNVFCSPSFTPRSFRGASRSSCSGSSTDTRSSLELLACSPRERSSTTSSSSLCEELDLQKALGLVAEHATLKHLAATRPQLDPPACPPPTLAPEVCAPGQEMVQPQCPSNRAAGTLQYAQDGLGSLLSEVLSGPQEPDMPRQVECGTADVSPPSGKADMLAASWGPASALQQASRPEVASALVQGHAAASDQTATVSEESCGEAPQASSSKQGAASAPVRLRANSLATRATSVQVPTPPTELDFQPVLRFWQSLDGQAAGVLPGRSCASRSTSLPLNTTDYTHHHYDCLQQLPTPVPSASPAQLRGKGIAASWICAVAGAAEEGRGRQGGPTPRGGVPHGMCSGVIQLLEQQQGATLARQEIGGQCSMPGASRLHASVGAGHMACGGVGRPAAPAAPLLQPPRTAASAKSPSVRTSAAWRC